MVGGLVGEMGEGLICWLVRLLVGWMDGWKVGGLDGKIGWLDGWLE